MIEGLVLVAIVVAIFVGFNIGGSSTGVAWGPAVGADVISKTGAAGLMILFVFLGGWTVGRNVVETLGGQLVPSSAFTPEATIGVLLFIGLGMLVANVYGVPVSTSMTAVGSIAGYGLATGKLQQDVLGGIVVWWLVAPVIGFWCGAVIGRYLYPHLEHRFAVNQSDGSLIVLDRNGRIPTPALGPDTTRRELASTTIVFLIACYMSFSAGASNIANAVAPLVGSNAVSLNAGILLGTAAIGLGSFTIARRTMESVGNDVTDLPLLASIVVMTVSSTITTALSWMGVPISLAMATVMCIVGLGWGRASRTSTAREMVAGDAETEIAVGAINTDTDEEPPEIGDESVDNVSAEELFDQTVIARFVAFWIIGPGVATALTYAVFAYAPL